MTLWGSLFHRSLCPEESAGPRGGHTCCTHPQLHRLPRASSSACPKLVTTQKQIWLAPAMVSPRDCILNMAVAKTLWGTLEPQLTPSRHPWGLLHWPIAELTNILKDQGGSTVCDICSFVPQNLATSLPPLPLYNHSHHPASKTILNWTRA